MNRAILCMALSSAAFAAPPAPTEFKGHVLGAPARMEALEAEWLLRCSDQFSGKKACRGYSSIAEVHSQVMATIGVDGRLDEINLFFASDRYQDVRRAMEAKYGKPQRVDRSPVQTKAGTLFHNETATWKRPDRAEISLTMRAGDVNTSLVMLQSAAAVADSNADFKKREAARKGDL